jgi:P27 family predicted phage terminase small subunit
MSGRGGARVGSGRKPTKPVKITRPVEFRSSASVIVTQPLNGEISTLPPEDLPAEQREFWHRYAGLAIEKRTLTTHTVAAFRLLCELDAYKRQVKERIDEDGWMFNKVSVDGAGVEHIEPKQHPLITAYGRTCKHVEGFMARFGLAPFGKAEIPLARRAAANPWEKVAQK